jgi:hypothetical protein
VARIGVAVGIVFLMVGKRDFQAMLARGLPAGVPDRMLGYLR